MNSKSTPRNVITPRRGYTGSYDGLPYSFNGDRPSAIATAPDLAAFFFALEPLRFSFLAVAFSASAFWAALYSFFWAFVYPCEAGESALGLSKGTFGAGDADLGLVHVEFL